MQISKDELINVLIKGRYESYIKKNSNYNPYVKSQTYDWECKLKINGFIFTDSYRGFNPYSGVEYVYAAGNDMPVWSCDYIGYVVSNTEISANKVYQFLKEARAEHLLNCNGNLFSEYRYENRLLQYRTHFQGDIKNLLQMENFYHNDEMIAQQLTAGRLKV